MVFLFFEAGLCIYSLRAVRCTVMKDWIVACFVHLTQRTSSSDRFFHNVVFVYMYLYICICIYVFVYMYLWGSMECGSSISHVGHGQYRFRIVAILAQDANTDIER